MKIYVDADACPVTRIAERVAMEYAIPVVLLCDTNHVLSSDYSEIRVIGAGADAVDIALINLCQRGILSLLRTTVLRRWRWARVRKPSIRTDDGTRMRTSMVC